MRGRADADGRVVSRGKIRVDARRAVAKLREHMLLDLHGYALEVVRAAVAGKAPYIDVSYDADDVVLTWPGVPPAAHRLTGLLDLVLSDGLSGEERRWRLLALGVNAALGLRPSFVDIIAAGVATPTECCRVRFTPELLEHAEGSAPATAEVIERPSDLPAQGLRIQVRRRLGWSTLRSAVVRAVPREVQTLAAAAMHLPTPLRLHGQPWDVRGAAPLLRVPFEVAGATRAWLAITAPGSSTGRLTFLEHGVRLASYRWSPEPDAPGQPYADVGMPVEVVVDAPELPTNASRAAIREDATLVARTLVGAAAAFHAAVEALTALVCDGGTVPDGVEICTTDTDGLEDALGAMVCVAVGARHRGDTLTELSRRLLALPLLRDGCGRPRSHASIVAGRETPLYVHQATEPIDPELGFWMRDVVWLRQRVAERALTMLRLADAAPVVEHARAAADRRRRLYAHAPGQPALPPSAAHLSRESFQVTEGPFAGLHGEAALVASGVGGRGVTARVFLDGRQLCTEQLAPHVIALGLEVALQWDGRLRVRFGFDGVERDEAFRSAIWYVAQVGVMQARDLSKRFPELDEPARRRIRPALRAAIGTTLTAGQSLELDDVLPAKLNADDPLWHAPCWRTTEPDRYESLDSMAAYAEERGGICVAGPAVQGAAADGRPIVALDQTERSWLGAALGPEVALIPYDRGALNARRSRRRDTRRASTLRAALARARPEAETDLFSPFLRFTRPAVEGLIGVGVETIRVHMHLGEELSKELAPRAFGPVVHVADDDRVLPTAEWDDRLWAPALQPLEPLERELLAAIVAALEGDAAAFDRLGNAPRRPSELGVVLTCYLLESALALRRRLEQLEALTSLGDAFSPTDEGTPQGGTTEPVADLTPRQPPARAGTARQPAGSVRPLAQDKASLADLEDRLSSVPILPMLDGDGRPRPSSLAEVAASRSEPVPVVDRVLGFETLCWRPVLAPDPRLARALRRWSPTGTKAASPHDISVRRLLADRHRASRTLLQRPRLDLTDLPSTHRKRENISDWIHVHEEVLPTALDGGGPLADEDGVPTVQPGDGAPSAAAALLPSVVTPGMDVHVLFRRRGLERLELREPSLPIAVRVNLLDPAYLEDWQRVSAQGREESRRLAVAAAFGLAESIVRAAQEGEPRLLFDDAEALELVAGLLELAPQLPYRDATKRLARLLRIKATRWPTIQGDFASWPALFRSKGVIYGASSRFAPWHPAPRAPSELDRPVLWIPPDSRGEALRRAIRALDKSVRDVTKAVNRLQARRAHDATARAPQLSGEPPSPLLRASLQALKVRSCEGELEIALGPGSDISLADLEGPAHQLPAAGLPIPVRAVARIDSVATERSIRRVVRDVGRAAIRHLRQLADRMDDLPAFARHHYRRYLCSQLPAHRTDDAGAVGPRDRQAAVFVDVAGRWWSLEELQATTAGGKSEPWWFTLHPPPYPARNYGRPILRLHETDDVARLRRTLPLRNMTNTLARDLAGEQRAQAQPVDEVALSPELRRHCFRTFNVGGGSLEGEVGILGPEGESQRGLRLHVDRRPLCTVEDGEGWPLCATLNDDTLKPNRAFDGLSSSKQRRLLVQGVRAAAQARLERWLPAPGYAIASRWIDTSRPTASAEACPSESDGADDGRRHPLVLGRLWLPSVWPTDPSVLIRTANRPRGEPLSLRVLGCLAQLDGRLPICGELWVAPQGGHESDLQRALVQLASTAFLAMLDELDPEQTGVNRRDLELFRWDAWLLLDPTGTPPTTEAGGGTMVDPAAIRQELSSRAELWYSDERGSSMGAFPDGGPSFILRGEAPIVHLLRHRTSPDALRELGGAAEDATGPRSSPWATTRPTEPPLELSAGGPPPSPEPPSPHPERVSNELLKEDSSFFDGLVRRVRGVFVDDPLTPAELASVPPDLASALAEALERLSLTGAPVQTVEYARSGRAVRYDEDRRRVLLNPLHPAVRALATPPLDAQRLAPLLAAAVSEVNRGLESVTDAEEQRALLELMSAREG